MSLQQGRVDGVIDGLLCPVGPSAPPDAQQRCAAVAHDLTKQERRQAAATDAAQESKHTEPIDQSQLQHPRRAPPNLA